MKTILLFTFLFSSLSFAAKDLPTVDHVDLTRYQGKWFEIASIPQWFQRKCVASTTAEYQILPGGDVRVYNSCQTADGKRIASEGRAKVVDHETNAKLKVTFAKIGKKYIYIFGGKYWIIKLDPNYRYAVIGHPNRKYGWILSRNSSLPRQTLTELSEFLHDQGYDVCQFMTTPQAGGIRNKRSLCAK